MIRTILALDNVSKMRKATIYSAAAPGRNDRFDNDKDPLWKTEEMSIKQIGEKV